MAPDALNVPAFLKLTQAQRAEAWKANPAKGSANGHSIPTASSPRWDLPKTLDPKSLPLLREMEAEKVRKKRERLDALKTWKEEHPNHKRKVTKRVTRRARREKPDGFRKRKDHEPRNQQQSVRARKGSRKGH